MQKIQTVAAYIRVSTEEQKLRGYSLAAQREKLIMYAQEHNMKIHDFYEDAGISGQKPMSKRPGLLRLVNDAKQGLFEHIIFIKLDRFFRNPQLYYECMNELGDIKWTTTEEFYDLSTAAGEMYFNVWLAIAQLEARQDGERVAFGNEHKVREGLAIYGKQALPFGFKVQNVERGKIVVHDPDEEPVAYEIINHYLTHQSKQATRFYIRDKFGINMTDKKLTTFLRSELICGRYRDNHKYVEPYVDPETFDRIQAITKKNIKYDYRKRYDYFFTGLIRCPECGSYLVGFTSKETWKDKTYHYQKYRCPKYQKEKTCSFKKGVSQKIIEKQLVDAVEEFLRIEVSQASVKEKNAPKPKINVDSINQEIDRLNYAWTTNKIRTVEQYEAMYTELTKKLEQATREEQAIKKRDLTHVEKLLSSGWKEMYHALNAENKLAFWRSFIQDIEIEWQENRAVTGINFF